MRFASEIKALLVDPLVPREVNSQGLFDFMGYEFVPAPETLFEGIRKLLPAACSIVDPQGVPLSRYWTLEKQDIEPAADEAAEIPGARLRGSHDERCPAGRLPLRRNRLQHGRELPQQLRPGPLQTFALGYRESILQRARVRTAGRGPLRHAPHRSC